MIRSGYSLFILLLILSIGCIKEESDEIKEPACTDENCFVEQGIRVGNTADNAAACEKLTNDCAKRHCDEKIAERLDDPSLCENLPLYHGKYESCESRAQLCYANFAGTNYSVCDKLPKELQSEFWGSPASPINLRCYSNTVLNLKRLGAYSDAFCYKFTNINYSWVTSRKTNYSVACEEFDQLSYLTIKARRPLNASLCEDEDECIYRVSGPEDGLKVCESIGDKYWKYLCILRLAKAESDVSYCDLINWSISKNIDCISYVKNQEFQ
ncbi:MAG: hypothetical protein V1702_06170 [Candidatus Woesearchaeota archaeon]